MKERPILFSGTMVRAILEGRKSQTRRVAKARDWKAAAPHAQAIDRMGQRWCYFDNDGCHDIAPPVCPYGEPGDRLWVRETWAIDCPEKLKREVWEGGQNRDWIIYRESGGGVHEGIGIRWRPSIFLPRWASRILLEVVGVRVERLSWISEEDCIAEGIEGSGDAGSVGWGRFAYRKLWEQINGPGSWEKNPWVWVVEFTRVGLEANTTEEPGRLEGDSTI